jgi:hypothetical protein
VGIVPPGLVIPEILVIKNIALDFRPKVIVGIVPPGLFIKTMTVNKSAEGTVYYRPWTEVHGKRKNK